MKHYTGVGSRNTPQSILNIMIALGSKLKLDGWTLRSGGALGADSAFEYGAGTHKRIYYAKDANRMSMLIAERHHPAWQLCSEHAKKLHGRNAFQVLGYDLDKPSEFLICWTPDGCISHKYRTIDTGGTGTAISIAEAYGVPIYNLQRKAHLAKVEVWLFK